jgi:tetratricopeptide (TPR) repeat protein
VGGAVAVDVQGYLANEVKLQREQTQAAEEWLNLGNALLQRGDPQQARAAFRNAYGLSQNDVAFNEDARVQLNNLRVQQALMGLNFGQAELAGAENQAAEKLRELKQRKGAAYTQEEAQQVFAGNRAEDNANFTRLAERIIEQQDAAVSAPAAIRATIPEQGRLLTFRRSVEVNKWADMQITLRATAARTISWMAKVGVLAAAFGVFGLVFLISRAVKAPEVR